MVSSLTNSLVKGIMRITVEWPKSNTLIDG
jgi:hypothetical protein